MKVLIPIVIPIAILLLTMASPTPALPGHRGVAGNCVEPFPPWPELPQRFVPRLSSLVPLGSSGTFVPFALVGYIGRIPTNPPTKAHAFKHDRSLERSFPERPLVCEVRGRHPDVNAWQGPAPADSEFCGSIRNTAFSAGENLTYKVSYVVAGISLSGGEATFKTDLEKLMGKNVYHVVAEVKSYHDILFKVRDKYETYIDTSTLQPYKFIRNVN